MSVIVVASAKGGPGKTTLACGLAVAAARAGERVALIDLDPLQAMTRWWELRNSDKNPRLVTGVDDLDEAIALLHEEGWELIIVDTPPAPLSISFDAIAHADLVLVPCRASPLDVEVVALTREMAERHRRPYAFVLSQSDETLRDEARRYLTSDEKGRVLEHSTSLSALYPRAMIAGRMPEEIDKGAIGQEMTNIFSDAKSLLGDSGASRPVNKRRTKRGS